MAKCHLRESHDALESGALVRGSIQWVGAWPDIMVPRIPRKKRSPVSEPPLLPIDDNVIPYGSTPRLRDEDLTSIKLPNDCESEGPAVSATTLDDTSIDFGTVVLSLQVGIARGTMELLRALPSPKGGEPKSRPSMRDNSLRP